MTDTSNQLLSLGLEQGTIGPLLGELIAKHQEKERALCFPELRALATAVGKCCRDLNSPLLWPIDDASERLAGAATLAAAGELRLRGWTNDVQGERVLLLAIAETTPLSLVKGATHARSLGAVEVHACALQVVGFDSPDLTGIFDSCVALGALQIAAPLAAS